MKSVTQYLADDGTGFETREECKAYEVMRFERRLVGLTIQQVMAATSREDLELADAIEALGRRIASKRVEAGEVKRRSKAAAPAPDAEPGQEAEVGEPSAHGRRKAA